MTAPNLVLASFTTKIDDISTAGSIFMPINDEMAGQVVEVRTAISGVITGGDAVITLSINGTALTNGVVTIANAGSAAGDVDTARPTGVVSIAAGEALEIETDGGSTGTVSALVSVTIAR